MINRCDNCRHSKVCIYKQKYYEKYMSENEQQQVMSGIEALQNIENVISNDTYYADLLRKEIRILKKELKELEKFRNKV